MEQGSSRGPIAKTTRVASKLSDHLLDTSKLPVPSPWPDANARLLGLGVGLPINPLDRIANFSDEAFERFVLEWAHDYLGKKVPEIVEVQQRGGAGDKGRDIIAWLDPSNVTHRRWRLYQCKH